MIRLQIKAQGSTKKNFQMPYIIVVEVAVVVKVAAVVVQTGPNNLWQNRASIPAMVVV